MENSSAHACFNHLTLKMKIISFRILSTLEQFLLIKSYIRDVEVGSRERKMGYRGSRQQHFQDEFPVKK
jgi:hypothetical protein